MGADSMRGITQWTLMQMPNPRESRVLETPTLSGWQVTAVVQCKSLACGYRGICSVTHAYDNVRLGKRQGKHAPLCDMLLRLCWQHACLLWSHTLATQACLT